MVYNINKNDHDGFSSISPKAQFKEIFGEEPTLILDSEYANYNHKLYKKIESFLENSKKILMKSAINDNKDLVDCEIIFHSEKSRILIAIKQYWDIDEYAPSELEQYDLQREEEISEVNYVKINKTTPFQAKIIIYSFSELETKVTDIFNKIISKDKKLAARERILNIICNSSEGLYLKSFTTNKISLNIDECYNDDFQEISELIVKRLSKKHDNGIILLHSEPGAGKTTYLRYLTNKIKDKRLIYLPPDMAYRLSDPDFITFLMNYPNSVLFIEDAENCLRTRDAGGNQAVSNLLNSSDGLLGDALKLQIVCTFNCDIKEIDSALLRPGRLIAEYRLEKLSLDKTLSLIKKTYGEDTNINLPTEPMTLAEIFNIKSEKYKTDTGKKNKIGFNTSK